MPPVRRNRLCSPLSEKEWSLANNWADYLSKLPDAVFKKPPEV